MRWLPWLQIPWMRNWLIWTGIGMGFLFFGGLAGHGYRRMLAATGPAAASTVAEAARAAGTAKGALSAIDWGGLFQLSIGGGIVVGLIGLALTLARHPSGIGWSLGLGAVGLVLFLIFIWPTPYKYYRAKGGGLIRVHRLSGSGDYVVPKVSTSAPQR